MATLNVIAGMFNFCSSLAIYGLSVSIAVRCEGRVMAIGRGHDWSICPEVKSTVNIEIDSQIDAHSSEN
jgi:hypothetical protein